MGSEPITVNFTDSDSEKFDSSSEDEDDTG
jgi:hypothetical protein